MTEKQMKRSLRTKLILTMLITMSLIGAVTLGSITWIQYQTSQKNIQKLEHHIRESIVSKGKVLIENHSLALKGLALDNAYGDVTKLVTRAVQEDEDVLYGLFLDGNGMPWVYASPDTKDQKQRDNWKRLKLTEDQITLKKPATRDVRLFGTEIYEVAMPVFDEDELLGTIRYGLSLHRIHVSINNAREESKAALKKNLYMLGGVVLLITFIGILLSARVASKITSPLRNLTQAANTIASGNREVKVSIESGDEIEVLGKSFNQMVSDLNESYASLEDMNKNLEQKVEERTAELSVRNRDMRMVLENVNQGFITVRRDGVMSPEHSAIVDQWFDPYADGTTFTEFTRKVDNNFAEWFELAWEDLLEGVMPMEVILDQMPMAMNMRNRDLQFSYSAILDDHDEIMGLLVVIADITEQLEYERKEAEQREILAVFRRVSQDKSGYIAYQEDARKLVNYICAEDAANDLILLKRQIHTLKGNSALFGIGSLAEICHQLEDEMADSGIAPTPERLNKVREVFDRLLANTEVFTSSSKESLEIAMTDYKQLLVSLEQPVPAEQVLRQVRQWLLEPVSRQFDRIEEQAKALAARLGKGEIEVIKEDNGVRLDPNKWTEFWSSLSHIVRNAVDHGIPDDLQGDSHGVLTLKSVDENGKIAISIADNGNGIDWDKVKAKAAEMGLPHKTRDDLVAVLFADGFTTRDSATATSGRGVGLSVVKHNVASHNGNVFVESQKGAGTTWRFEFPHS
ncbi:MAG: HAMP domain-containing protein [Deltaproteobacteria bacterium]|nr:HAMP domain-containing protein [Deltaproteobacteria bacterium]